MDFLDRHDKKGYYIVMDNCRIHHSALVLDAINKRGYKPLFMPPYSPFLNPIEGRLVKDQEICQEKRLG
jgi:transposase